MVLRRVMREIVATIEVSDG